MRPKGVFRAEKTEGEAASQSWTAPDSGGITTITYSLCSQNWSFLPFQRFFVFLRNFFPQLLCNYECFMSIHVCLNIL